MRAACSDYLRDHRDDVERGAIAFRVPSRSLVLRSTCWQRPARALAHAYRRERERPFYLLFYVQVAFLAAVTNESVRELRLHRRQYGWQPDGDSAQIDVRRIDLLIRYVTPYGNVILASVCV